MRRVIRIGIIILLVAVAATPLLFLYRPSQPTGEQTETLSVYSSFGAIYALSEEILKDVPDLTHHQLIQPQDGCLRGYEASDWDVYQMVYGADLIILGGNGLESFADGIESLGENAPATITITEGLDLLDMDASDDEESHWRGKNPHAYLSIALSKNLLYNIAINMAQADPRYAEIYSQNLNAALEKMNALQTEQQTVKEIISGNSVIIMNEALYYVAQEYGLEIAYAYRRESGAMPYDNALTECLETLAEYDAKVILIEKQAPKEFTDALKNAGYTVAKIDILSSVWENTAENAYIHAQSDNMRTLQSAFESEG